MNEIHTLQYKINALEQLLDAQEKSIIEQTDKLVESEARFKAIFEGSNDALMLLTEKGFFDCNARTLEMFGFENKEEFTRIHPADISPPDQPDGRESFPAAQERIKTAFERGSNRFEWIHRRKNGEDFPAEVLLSAFVLSGKNVLQATVRDITERKLAEKALLESEKSFRSMFEMTSEGVVLMSPRTGRFIAANPAMCAMFGYTEEEFRTLTPEDITPHEFKEVMRRSIQNLFGKGKVPDHEGSSIKKDGTLVHSIVGSRLLPWKGEMAGYITFKNVTFLKEMQEQLKKKNAEVLAFTDTIVHDLKKPLTVTKTVCSLIARNAFGKLAGEGPEAIGTCMEAIEYMQEMLDDLLACAKLEAGTATLGRQTVQCASLCRHVLDRLKFQIREKNIAVSLDGLDIEVDADPKGLEKIFMNLIGNSVNYIGSGPDRKICIAAKTGKGPVEISIRDNGLGIPEEMQKRLFTKFNRGFNVSGIGGTGLGLSIVKGIVLAHGGKIWFESREGEGTAFHFTLG